MKSAQRGASLLIPVMLVLTVAAFGAIVIASQAGGSVRATRAQADSVEALALAESGLERAAKRYASGTACGALAETITDLSALGVSGRTIEIGAGLATDFASVALESALSQCRVPVTATIDDSSVSRTIHAIIDKNLLGGTSNFTFDVPAAPGAPRGWTLDPPASYAENGGPDGVFPACSRAGWLVKTQNANRQARAELQTPVNATVDALSTTTVAFHWRMTDRTGGGCAAGANSGPAWPGSCGGGGNAEGQVCFRFLGGGVAAAVASFSSNATSSVAVPCPDAGAPSAFAPCAANYQAGYPAKETLTMTMIGFGTLTLTDFLVNLRLRRNGRRELFVDHIEAVNDTAIGAARVQEWRDCAASSCPAT